MPDESIRTLFIDTSSLRRAGFQDPDLRKLLFLSKELSLRVVVSHIAWEEWRTQFLEKSCAKVRAVRDAFDGLKSSVPSNFILSGLTSPLALAVWGDTEIEAASKTMMSRFAAENRIEILPIGSDHAERAWRSYFHVTVQPPFNPAVKERTERRKDIPDSWIYEAAIDLARAKGDLAALCHDEKLANALANLGIRVFREPAEFVMELERQSAPAAKTPISVELATTAATPLAASLAEALDAYRDHERRVLGFIAHFGAPAKEQLWELLARVGVPAEVAKNAADRLRLAGLIRDTGNHYLIATKRLEPLALASVEDDIIKLLSQEPSNGL